MAVTTLYYAYVFIAVFNEEIDWVADDIYATLHTVTEVPNQDTDQYYDDLANELATSNGYTAEGDLMGTEAITQTLNVIDLDTADPQWTATGAGFTARILVLTDRTPATDATRPLILWSDFGQDETASGGGTFTYAVNVGGWATITPANAP